LIFNNRESLSAKAEKGRIKWINSNGIKTQNFGM